MNTGAAVRFAAQASQKTQDSVDEEVEMGSSAQAERRHVPRRAFRGTVELAMPEDAEAYEADGVDLSIGGMSLRTSLLPDRGSELACRFKLEDGRRVTARGEVVWAQDVGSDAGEFGLRFTELAEADEDAIRGTFTGQTEEDATAAAPPEPSKARLHIAGMSSPLRARIRTEMDDAIVLGSDLSFLKLGEAIEIERQEGKREKGRIEDVTVEVDSETHIARLMLTVALSPASRTLKHHALPASPVVEPIALEKRRALTPIAAPPAAVKLPPLPTPSALASDSIIEAAPEDDLEPYGVKLAADDAGPHGAMDAEQAEAVTSASPSVRTAPAWLVSALAAMRSLARTVATKAGPTVLRVVKAVVAFVLLAYTTVRSRIQGTPIEAESPRTTSGRRPQNPASQRAESPATPPQRKKIGLYVLAGVGSVAIAFAVATSSRDPRPRTPRPQVAVAPPAEVAAPETAVDPTAQGPESAAAAGEPTGNTGANGPVTGEPPVGANAPANMNGPDDMTPAPRRVTATAPRARTLPTDLVAAARSRNANVDTDRPTIRGATAPARRVAPVAAAAPQPAAPAAHVLGSPSVRTGTVLRMRMDGVIGGIAGGPGAGNTLVIRMAGRRSLDMAAPLVRQDLRLLNASVYNRASGAELTLRFRDAVPQYQAHTRGNTLEIVLAPPAARRVAAASVRAR